MLFILLIVLAKKRKFGILGQVFIGWVMDFAILVKKVEKL